MHIVLQDETMTGDDGDEEDVTSEDGACEDWANCQPLTANDVIQQLGGKTVFKTCN